MALKCTCGLFWPCIFVDIVSDMILRQVWSLLDLWLQSYDYLKVQLGLEATANMPNEPNCISVSIKVQWSIDTNHTLQYQSNEHANAYFYASIHYCTYNNCTSSKYTLLPETCQNAVCSNTVALKCTCGLFWPCICVDIVSEMILRQVWSLLDLWLQSYDYLKVQLGLKATANMPNEPNWISMSMKVQWSIDTNHTLQY